MAYQAGYYRLPGTYLFFFVLLQIPSIIFALLVLLPLVVVTQIRGHIVGSCPASPLQHVPFIFIARRIQHFLVQPGGIYQRHHAACILLRINKKKRHVSCEVEDFVDVMHKYTPEYILVA